jgi:hypothetical protein
MSSETATRRLDLTAIVLSALCAAHCLALPLLAAGLPWLALLGLANDWFHLAALLVVVPVSAVALRRGWRQHRDRLPPVLGVLGLGLMVLAVAIVRHPAVPETAEIAFTLAGVSLLAAAHAVNFRNFLLVCRVGIV